VVALQREWSGWKAATDAQLNELRMDADVRSWIRSSVRFGTGGNADFWVWNTSRITDPVRMEYEVVFLGARNLDRWQTFESSEAMWEHAIRVYGPEYETIFQPL